MRRAVGHRRDDRADPAEASEDEADHERPGRGADREAAAGGGHVDQADGHADREAEREAADVDVGHAAVAVAEVLADLGHPVAWRDDPQPVAHGEHERVVGDEVDVAAAHPAHGGPELRVEVELADGVADERLARQGDPAEVEVVPVLDDVVRGHVAQPRGDVVEGGARADDGDEVVVADRSRCRPGTMVGFAAWACLSRETRDLAGRGPR